MMVVMMVVMIDGCGCGDGNDSYYYYYTKLNLPHRAFQIQLHAVKTIVN